MKIERVDLGVVLDEEVKYDPSPGTKYEIAPGIWGTMKLPTADIMEQVGDLFARNNGTPTDLQVARVVLDFDKEFDDKDIVYGMPSRATADFFLLLGRIGMKLKRLSEPSGDQESQASDKPE